MEAFAVSWAVLLLVFLIARMWVGVALTCWVPVTLANVVMAGLWHTVGAPRSSEPEFRFTAIASALLAVAVLGVILLTARRRWGLWVTLALALLLAIGWGYLMYEELIVPSYEVPETEWLVYGGFIAGHLLAAVFVLPVLRYRPSAVSARVFE